MKNVNELEVELNRLLEIGVTVVERVEVNRDIVYEKVTFNAG